MGLEKYQEIINLDHHVSAVRRPMSMYNRAAQFAPFAALSGHNEAIDETAKRNLDRYTNEDSDDI